MINENSIKLWIKSGWTINHKLNVCVLNLRNSNHRNLSENKQIEIKKLEHKDIEYLLELDHKIFEDYWKNSRSSLEETMKSCNNNYLFKSGSQNNLDGYAILGETRKFTYLQRIGIVKNYQGSGLGLSLIHI